MARKRVPRGAVYLEAPPVLPPTKVSDLADAIRAIRILGGADAAGWKAHDRKRVAEGVADWLADYGTWVEHVQWGTKELLLQAAAKVGERSGERKRRE